MALKEKIRVRLKSYDHTLIDTAAEKIAAVAKANGCEVSGPIPLPTDREIVTILAVRPCQQGQPRAVRVPDPQETHRHHEAVSEDSGRFDEHRAARRR